MLKYGNRPHTIITKILVESEMALFPKRILISLCKQVSLLYAVYILIFKNQIIIIEIIPRIMFLDFEKF